MKIRDITSKLLENSSNIVKNFRGLKNSVKGEIFQKLPIKTQIFLVSSLSNDEILNFIKFMDFDDTTDVIQLLSKRRQKYIINKLNKDKQQKISFLLKFNPKSAAGLMDINYVLVSPEDQIENIKKVLEKFEEHTGRSPTILVEYEGTFLGELPLFSLITAKKNELVKKYITDISTIKYDEKEEKVINTFLNNPHNKVIVLDDDNSVLGIIYTDDILRIINKKRYKGLSSFAGISDEEDVLDKFGLKVKHRYKWLIINLFTELLAGFTVNQFNNVIAKYIILASFLPIVAGMGGNAATQTLAVIVRGIAFNEVSYNNVKKVLFNEIIASFLNGVISGVFLAALGLIYKFTPLLGLILFLSMVGNMIIAAIAGTTIPLILKKFGKDPANSATIFITTATDVCGFFILLFLAKIILL